MIRLPPPARRAFAALAAALVALAPLVQVAHAEAMLAMGMGVDCNRPAMAHGGMAMPAPHSRQNPHDHSCCDSCATCCAAPLALPVAGVSLDATIAIRLAAANLPTPASFAPRHPHILPFSLAPPLRSV